VSLSAFDRLMADLPPAFGLSETRKARSSAFSLPVVRRRRILGWNGSSRPMLCIGETPANYCSLGSLQKSLVATF
jgi:hypothetical protein